MLDKNVAKEIIENIAVLDETVKIYGLVSNEVSSKVDVFISEYFKGDLNWSGNYEIEDFEDLYFSPSNWIRINKDDFSYKDCFARFYLSYESKYSEMEVTEYQLTSLFENKANERAVFVFSPWFDNYKKLTKSMWKKFAQQVLESTELEALGFKFYSTEGLWYLLISPINPKYFAECYLNDNTEDAFTPIKEALDILMKATPIFDKIIEKAKAEFGVAED